MRDGLQGRAYLEELHCLGTVLLVKVGEAERVKLWFYGCGLVEVENRKGSVIMTGILEAGSTGVLPEILIPN